MTRHLPTTTLCTGLLLASLGGGCSGGASSKTAGATDADAVPKLALTEVNRYGSEQSPDTGFSAIRGVTVDQDGRIYVMDAQDLRIRVFDSAGTLVRTIGRKGSGPGEFKFGGPMGVRGDTLWAVDLMASRITLFGLDGTVLSTGTFSPVNVPAAGGATGMVVPMLMRPDGTFLGDIAIWAMTRTKAPASDSAPRIVFDASGAVVDTLGWYHPRTVSMGGDRVQVDGRSYGVPQPQPEEAMTLLLPDGEVVVTPSAAGGGKPGTFTVVRHTFSGDTVYRRTFSYAPVGYPPEYLDTLAMRYATLYNGGSPKPSMSAFRAIRAKMSFPGVQPPVQSEVIGVDGGIWLQREERGGSGSEWLVLGPDGTARGRVQLPQHARPRWIRGDEVLVSVADEMGVPWLVRYRVETS